MEEFIRTIGLGTFSRVMLVRRHTTKSIEYSALKIMAIRYIIELKQVHHVNDERAVLSTIQHPFIVQFYDSCRDNRYLYLSMEFLEGGELFSYFRRAGCFQESIVRFYACEVILALEYLHNHSIVYRDIKLENLVLNRSGHVKLTDFGFAKYIQDRTFTLCGTTEYLAPEMILSSSGHSFGVDWYALGILIYELLVGYTPFATNNSEQHPSHTYMNILHGAIPWPVSPVNGHRVVGRVARDLIRKLLHRDRTRRLGCMAARANDVKQHRWFNEILWTDIIEQRILPPINPRVDFPGDTQNFDIFNEEPFQESECTIDEYNLFKNF